MKDKIIESYDNFIQSITARNHDPISSFNVTTFRLFKAGWLACEENTKSQVEEPELKPCPFCGKVDTLKFFDCNDFIEDGSNKNQRVVCFTYEDGCGGAGGYRENREEAIKLWNNR